MKYLRDDPTLCSLAAPRRLEPPLKDRPQFRNQREGTSLEIRNRRVRETGQRLRSAEPGNNKNVPTMKVIDGSLGALI